MNFIEKCCIINTANTHLLLPRVIHDVITLAFLYQSIYLLLLFCCQCILIYICLYIDIYLLSTIGNTIMIITKSINLLPGTLSLTLYVFLQPRRHPNVRYSFNPPSSQSRRNIYRAMRCPRQTKTWRLGVWCHDGSSWSNGVPEGNDPM